MHISSNQVMFTMCTDYHDLAVCAIQHGSTAAKWHIHKDNWLQYLKVGQEKMYFTICSRYMCILAF